MKSKTQSRNEKRSIPVPVRWIVIALATISLAAYVIATPGGFLSTFDMVGYAVCHRIESHSFVIGGRQLPLCARCTGTFTGAIVGLVGQAWVLKRRRASAFPPLPIILLLVGFIGLMGFDGLNSYLTFFPYVPHLYEPSNWLRVATGSLNGLAMSALIYPVINATLWRRPVEERAIRHMGDLGILLLLEAGMVALVLSRWSILLYPLAVASASGVLVLLSCINTVIFVMIINRENTLQGWREAIIPYLAGLTISLIQIGIIDLIRYTLTGTLGGFPSLG